MLVYRTIFESFVQKYKKDNPHLSHNTALFDATNLWKTLTESEKKKYQKKHEHAKRKYMHLYEAFLKVSRVDTLSYN